MRTLLRILGDVLLIAAAFLPSAIALLQATGHL